MANEEQWDHERIEGFRVVSPDTDEVNWPRDVLRAHRAAQEPGDIEGKPNVSPGRVALQNAPPTARMRHEMAERPWRARIVQEGRSPDDLVGDPIVLLDGEPPTRLTRAERLEANVTELRMMEASALERLRGSVVALNIYGDMEEHSAADRWTDESSVRAGVVRGRSPVLTGPHRSTRGFLEGRRVNGPYVMFWAFAAVAVAVFAAFVYAVTNWVY